VARQNKTPQYNGHGVTPITHRYLIRKSNQHKNYTVRDSNPSRNLTEQWEGSIITPRPTVCLKNQGIKYILITFQFVVLSMPKADWLKSDASVLLR